MSESFSDLWALSNPVKSQQPQPKTLGVAANAPTNVALRPPPDTFSMLASTGPRPNHRPITPSTNPRPITPSANHTPIPSKNGTAISDAFGGLVSFGNSVSRDDGLTIAERAAKAELERQERAEKDNTAFNVQESFWDKYENTQIGKPSPSDAHVKSNGLWDLDFLTQDQTSSSEPSRAPNPSESSDNNDTWDLNFIDSNTPASATAPATVPKDIFDMDHPDNTLEVLPESRITEPQPPRPNTPGSFDFGDREDQLETVESQDEDDILGSILPPVEAGNDITSQQQGLQEQADKLLAQASMIGRTMFNKANAFWKESRDKVGKVYEEQRSSLPRESRPRWMDNVRVDGDEFPPDKSRDLPEIRRIPIQPQRPTSDQRHSQPPVSLFAADDPVYRSPARRRSPATSSSSKILSPSPISSSATLPLIVRPSIEASPSALAASGTHKAVATEHFKLGRFAEAEVAYTGAIDALPDSHLLRIPLYNNRALTRLKIGEYKGTINDTTELLRIIADGDMAWHPGREEAGVKERFGNAFSKALRRRAEAYEGLEKWKDALDDWERLRAAAWVGLALKEDAIKGAGRCRQMARDGSSSSIPPKVTLKPKPKPKPRAEYSPARIVTPSPSEALTRVRAAHTALEKEDQVRHELKDIVDARLTAWRNGKENNIRALIASLDLVLSPTFRWQKVGMSELVSSGQVKAKYTKAIAKLHPDKLNVNNTTLEERMIANSVFATLNEAWNAFR